MALSSFAEIGRLVKKNYPGDYDSINDDELGRKAYSHNPDDYPDFNPNAAQGGSVPPPVAPPPAAQPTGAAPKTTGPADSGDVNVFDNPGVYFDSMKNKFKSSIVEGTIGAVKGVGATMQAAAKLPPEVYNVALGPVAPFAQKVWDVAGSEVFRKSEDIKKQWENSQMAKSLAPDPRVKDSFGVKLAGGVASTVPVVAAAIANPLAGIATAWSMGANELSEDVDRYEKETGNKVDPERRALAVGLGGLVGSVDALVPAGVTKPLSKILMRGAGESVLAAAKRGMAEIGKEEIAKSFKTHLLKTMGKEGFTEGIQELGNNLIARGVYDDKKDLFQNVVDAALIGFFTGGVLEGTIGGGGRAVLKSLANAAEVKAKREGGTDAGAPPAPETGPTVPTAGPAQTAPPAPPAPGAAPTAPPAGPTTDPAATPGPTPNVEGMADTFIDSDGKQHIWKPNPAQPGSWLLYQVKSNGTETLVARLPNMKYRLDFQDKMEGKKSPGEQELLDLQQENARLMQEREAQEAAIENEEADLDPINNDASVDPGSVLQVDQPAAPVASIDDQIQALALNAEDMLKKAAASKDVNERAKLISSAQQALDLVNQLKAQTAQPVTAQPEVQTQPEARTQPEAQTAPEAAPTPALEPLTTQPPMAQETTGPVDLPPVAPPPVAPPAAGPIAPPLRPPVAPQFTPQAAPPQAPVTPQAPVLESGLPPVAPPVVQPEAPAPAAAPAAIEPAPAPAAEVPVAESGKKGKKAKKERKPKEPRILPMKAEASELPTVVPPDSVTSSTPDLYDAKPNQLTGPEPVATKPSDPGAEAQAASLIEQAKADARGRTTYLSDERPVEFLETPLAVPDSDIPNGSLVVAGMNDENGQYYVDGEFRGVGEDLDGNPVYHVYDAIGRHIWHVPIGTELVVYGTPVVEDIDVDTNEDVTNPDPYGDALSPEAARQPLADTANDVPVPAKEIPVQDPVTPYAERTPAPIFLSDMLRTFMTHVVKASDPVRGEDVVDTRGESAMHADPVLTADQIIQASDPETIGRIIGKGVDTADIAASLMDVAILNDPTKQRHPGVREIRAALKQMEKAGYIRMNGAKAQFTKAGIEAVVDGSFDPAFETTGPAVSEVKPVSKKRKKSEKGALVFGPLPTTAQAAARFRQAIQEMFARLKGSGFMNGMVRLLGHGNAAISKRYGAEGEMFVNLMKQARFAGEQNAGRASQILRIGGIENKELIDNPDAVQDIHDILTGRKQVSTIPGVNRLAAAMRKVTDDVADRAIALNVKVTSARGKRLPFLKHKDYIPITYNYEALKSDTNVRQDVVYNMIKQGWVQNETEALKLIKDTVEYMTSEGGIVDPPHSLMDWSLRYGGVHGATQNSTKKALIRYRKAVKSQDPGAIRNSSLEYIRKTRLPIYDPNMFRVMPANAASAHARLSIIEKIGQDSDIAKLLISSAGKRGVNTAQMVEDFNRLLGQHRQESDLFGAALATARLAALFKLAYASISNTMQPLNVLEMTDPSVFLASVKESVTEYAMDLAVESGALTEEVINEAVQGYSHGQGLGKAGNWMMKVNGFKAIERNNRRTAAIGGALWAKKNLGLIRYEASQAGMTGSQYISSGRMSSSAKDALTILNDFYGYDIGQITNMADTGMTRQEELVAAKIMSDETQFRSDPGSLPLWAQTSAGKAVWLFKHFAYHQAAFRAKQAARAFKQVGTAVSDYRAAGGSSVLGGIAHVAQDRGARRALWSTFVASTVSPLFGHAALQARYMLMNGTISMREFEDFWTALWESYAAGGAFGMFIDSVQGFNREDHPGWSFIHWAAGPVAGLGADVIGYANTMTRHAKAGEEMKMVGDTYRYVNATFPGVRMVTSHFKPWLHEIGAEPEGTIASKTRGRVSLGSGMNRKYAKPARDAQPLPAY